MTDNPARTILPDTVGRKRERDTNSEEEEISLI